MDSNSGKVPRKLFILKWEKQFTNNIIIIIIIITSNGGKLLLIFSHFIMGRLLLIWVRD